MTEGLTGSLSIVDVPGSGIDRLVEAPELYLVMQADAPLAPSLRLPLWAVDRVEIGRGPTADPQHALSDRTLRLRLPDRRMSSSHAVIEIRGSARDEVWVRDLGSKNGTYVNGSVQTESKLTDGDVLELGHSFLLFRGTGLRWGDTDLRPRVLSSPTLMTFDPGLAQAYVSVADVASTDLGILITGDSGTGKEVLARAIHSLSGKSGPFVVLDPGAAASQPADRVLFGDPSSETTGLVDAAAHGTLFLDEMSDLPESWQLALLRVLQERKVTSLKTQDSRPVTFRPIGTSHRVLDEEVQQGRFRIDLLGRISGVRVHISPLKDRKQDIGLLLRGILASDGEHDRVQFRRRTVLSLLRHDWPYNIRELETAIRHGLIRAKDQPVAIEHLPVALQAAIGPRSVGKPPEASSDALPTATKDVSKEAQTAEAVVETAPLFSVRLLGPLEVCLGDERLTLPPSKKVRALLAYLVTTGRPHRRERLGAMFCELADQQRAALRWQLSKVRGVLKAGQIDRLLANREEVSVPLDALDADYHEVKKGVVDIDTASVDTLDRLAKLYRGRFIEGLELPDCGEFEAWRVAVEEECLVRRVSILRALVRHAETSPTIVLPHARDLMSILPDDARVGVQVEALKKRVRQLNLAGD